MISNSINSRTIEKQITSINDSPSRSKRMRVSIKGGITNKKFGTTLEQDIVPCFSYVLIYENPLD